MPQVEPRAEAPERETNSTRLSHAEMAAELRRREELLKTGSSGVTDQWRVYTHIVNSLRLGPPLRLMVEANAGTGKGFLLTTVYLWCIVNGSYCSPHLISYWDRLPSDML